MMRILRHIPQWLTYRGHRSRYDFRSRSEAGQSLPAALITLAVASLLLTPFLTFVSSRSLGTGVAQETFNDLYAADAGVEYGIWSLLNVPSIRNTADLNAGTAQSLAFPGSLNGITPTISITALPIGNWNPDPPGAPADLTWEFGNGGGSLAYAGKECVYALGGNKKNNFGCYNISGDSWNSSLASLPKNVDGEDSLVHGGGNSLFALVGGKKDNFWSYNTSSDTWNMLEIIGEKVKVDQGAALVYVNAKKLLYAFSGNSKDFWRYDISSKGWSSMADAPGTTKTGADLIYTGGDYIYAIQGNNSTAFWRFKIPNGPWSTLPNIPVVVKEGGALAYYGGDYLYALQGNSTDFWRYSVTMNSWTILAAAPDAVGAGADLIFTHSKGGFSLQGGKNTDYWEFEVTPPRYKISVQAASVSIDTLYEIDGTTRTILFWDID